MNREQILKATGDELSRLAGEVLQPEKEKCVCEKPTVMDIWNELRCSTCGLYPNENLIPLTPDNQVKWRNWAVAEYGQEKFKLALWQVWDATPYIVNDFEVWLACEIQPEHYIKAACLCKLGK